MTPKCYFVGLFLFLHIVYSLDKPSVQVIILTIGHSGSKTLVKVLNQHSQLHMEGELLFNAKYKNDLELTKKRIKDIFLNVLETTKTHVVGFKLLYHQIWKHPAPFFEWIQQHYPQLRIIHLIRANYFEHYLSFYASRKTHTTKQIIDHISDTGLRVETMKRLVKQHQGPTLTLLYEEMAQQFEKELHSILEFLELPYEDLSFSAKDKLDSMMPWEKVFNWNMVCTAIRLRERHDDQLNDCLKLWSTARWNSEAHAVKDICLL